MARCVIMAYGMVLGVFSLGALFQGYINEEIVFFALLGTLGTGLLWADLWGMTFTGKEKGKSSS